jgi:hypothetical protein
MGRLNASHASATALANASPNSTVGRIREYMDAMTLASTLVDDPTTEVSFKGQMVNYNDLIELAAGALTSAANKPIDASVVDQVNANLSAKTGSVFDSAVVVDVKDKLAGI